MFVDKFKTGQIAVRFPNKFDGITFLTYLDKHGLTWRSGDKLLSIYKRTDWRKEPLAYRLTDSENFREGVVFAQLKIEKGEINQVIDFYPELITDIEINIDQDEILELLGG